MRFPLSVSVSSGVGMPARRELHFSPLPENEASLRQWEGLLEEDVIGIGLIDPDGNSISLKGNVEITRISPPELSARVGKKLFRIKGTSPKIELISIEIAIKPEISISDDAIIGSFARPCRTHSTEIPLAKATPVKSRKITKNALKEEFRLSKLAFFFNH